MNLNEKIELLQKLANGHTNRERRLKIAVVFISIFIVALIAAIAIWADPIIATINWAAPETTNKILFAIAIILFFKD